MIVYQVLYTDVSDHLPEYATRWRWATDSAIFSVWCCARVCTGSSGLSARLPGRRGLYWFVRDATRLPVGMDVTRALTVLAMILVMCLMSALLAMRRLVDADPAEIF